MDIIEKIYQHFTKHYLVSTDSRKITPGCVFFALKGEHFDGNDYAYQVALDNIASCAVSCRKDLPYHERLFIVDDTTKALQDLARMHRERHNIPVIGITGTNGKTTTKELIASVLSQKYNIINTQGNFNNHIGVPLTLLQIKNNTEIAVVEMGANHPYEIETLCNIAKPNFGLITNVGKAHLEGFGSFEGIVKTKKELYDYLKNNNGKAFVNSDNNILIDIAKDIPSYYYGKNNNADIIVNVHSSSPYLYATWDDNIIKTNLIGEYNIENIAASIAVGKYFNIENNLIIKAIEEYKPTNNRSQYIKTEKNEIVMDAYNANPISMFNAITNFRNISSENALLILGDMKELGKDSETEHQYIIRLINELKFNNIILVGKEFGKICNNCTNTHFNDVDELICHIKNSSIHDKKILIKGSHSIHLEKLINYL